MDLNSDQPFPVSTSFAKSLLKQPAAFSTTAVSEQTPLSFRKTAYIWYFYKFCRQLGTRMKRTFIGLREPVIWQNKEKHWKLTCLHLATRINVDKADMWLLFNSDI